MYERSCFFYPVSVADATRTRTEDGQPPTAAPSKGERTRAAILDRAVDLASVEGLEGLTIGRLASDLGMSKSGLFRHFGSKQDLQLATVGAAGRRFVAMVIEPAQSTPDGAARLRAMAERYLDYLDSFPGGCFWGATASEFDDRPGPVRDAIAASMDAWMAELVRQSKAAGIGDPERYAFELYAVVMAANARWRLSGDRAAFDLARAALARLEAELPG
jgi:AcrR family transcriptional regulator